MVYNIPKRPWVQFESGTVYDSEAGTCFGEKLSAHLLSRRKNGALIPSAPRLQVICMIPPVEEVSGRFRAEDGPRSERLEHGNRFLFTLHLEKAPKNQSQKKKQQ